MKSENHELDIRMFPEISRKQMLLSCKNMAACGVGFKYSGIRDETTLQITASRGFDSGPLRYNQFAILLYLEVFVISRMKRMDSESVLSRS